MIGKMDAKRLSELLDNYFSQANKNLAEEGIVRSEQYWKDWKECLIEKFNNNKEEYE